jgi:lipoprotein signal peptidase
VATGPLSESASREPSAALADLAPQPRTALRDFGSHLRFWGVVAGGLALDLWSKDWAFGTLRQGGNRVVIPNVLEFHTTLNPGALFGIGAGKTSVFLVASVVALLLVLWMFAQSSRRHWFMHIALGAILAGALGNMYDRVFVQLVGRLNVPGCTAQYFVLDSPAAEQTAPGDHPVRLLYEFPVDADAPPPWPVPAELELPEHVGYVRDFIKIPTRWFNGKDIWPWIFNVADTLLVCGVIILAVRMLRERKPAPVPPRLDAPVENT